MALDYETRYPGQVAPASVAYPFGQAQNVTIPGDGTGTPWEADLTNDLFGFLQALLDSAGITPNDLSDTAINSQYLNAIGALSGRTFDNITDAMNADLTDLQVITTRSFLSGAGADPEGGAPYHRDGTSGTASTLYTNSNGFYDANGDGFRLSTAFIPNSAHFGIVMDGTTDNSANIEKMLTYLDGKMAYFQPGHCRITQRIDTNITSEIRISGIGPVDAAALANGLVELNSATFDIVDLTDYIDRYTVFRCDNTNFLGGTDGGSYEANTNTRVLRNFFAYGINGAEIGYHIEMRSTVLERICFARFEFAGEIIRGGQNGYRNLVSLDTNGHNVGASGSGATFLSGCQSLVCSSRIAGDYTTTVAANRLTTTTFGRCFHRLNANMLALSTGFRGAQWRDMNGVTIEGVGSYGGFFMYNCARTVFDGYIENYDTNGFVASDATPHPLYLLDCQVEVGSNYLANVTNNLLVEVTQATTGGGGLLNELTYTPGNIEATVVARRSLVDTLQPLAKFTYADNPEYDAANVLGLPITVVTPGGSDVYTFPGFFTETRQQSNGFVGNLHIAVVRNANFATNALRSYFIQHLIYTGPTSQLKQTSLAQHNDATVNFEITITTIATNASGDLMITIAWGNNWAGGTTFRLLPCAIGGGTQSLS